MKRLFLLITGLFLFSTLSRAQVSPGSVEFVRQFKMLEAELPRERIYLHTDRDWYYFGDRIWFSAYVLSGPLTLPSEMSRVLYVELYTPDGDLAKREAVPIALGRAEGSLPFGEMDAQSGTYRVKAYTAWALNFGESYVYTKDVTVITDEEAKTKADDADAPDLQFLPESGHLVAGIPSRTGFKAVDKDGYGVDISGIIYDDNGNTITDFKSEYLGMGMVTFTPEEGRSYYAVSGDQQYPLPEVMAQGVVMQVNDAPNQMIIRVQSKGYDPGGSLLLFAQVRGEVFAASEVLLDAQGNAVTAVPTANIPTGVVHFTLLDRAGIPIAERLAFNKNPVDRMNVDIQMDDFVTEVRGRTGFTLRVSDANGAALPANISVSVFDDGIVPFNYGRGNIRSRVLLETELMGHVENPMYYFSDEPRADEHLDLLMLTQGWRAYDMESVLSRDNIELFTMPEKGLRISGKVTRGIRSREQGDAPIFFSLGSNNDETVVVTTEEDGSFMIEDLDFLGEEKISVKANTEDGNDGVQVLMDEQFSYLPDDGQDIPQTADEVIPMLQQPETDSQNMAGDGTVLANVSERAKAVAQDDEQFVEAQMQGELEEITVSSTRINQNEVGMQDDYITMIARDASGRRSFFDMDEQEYLQLLTIDQLINQLPGVSVANNQIEIRTGTASVNTNAPPLVLLNGSQTTYENIRNLNSRDIKTISVLRSSADLAILGAVGSGGAISIQLRDGVSDPYVTGFYTGKIQGYQLPTRFYSPKYGLTVPKDIDKKDNRITLHWEPQLYVPASGERVIFWANDIPSNYRVIVEGITENGDPFFGTKVFGVVE